jgi:hypothetical protein
VAAAGQFSWPPAGSYLAVYGQFLVAVVIRPAAWRSGRARRPPPEEQQNSQIRTVAYTP